MLSMPPLQDKNLLINNKHVVEECMSELVHEDLTDECDYIWGFNYHVYFILMYLLHFQADFKPNWPSSCRAFTNI